MSQTLVLGAHTGHYTSILRVLFRIWSISIRGKLRFGWMVNGSGRVITRIWLTCSGHCVLNTSVLLTRTQSDYKCQTYPACPTYFQVSLVKNGNFFRLIVVATMVRTKYQWLPNTEGNKLTARLHPLFYFKIWTSSLLGRNKKLKTQDCEAYKSNLGQNRHWTLPTSRGNFTFGKSKF